MNTVIWIHGFPLSSEIFEKQRTIRGLQHVMPDLPGFGRTRPAMIESIDDYARHILGAVQEEKATFAGLSMGGYICFAIARLAPERMNGLILIDTRETPDTAEARKGRFETIEKVKQQGVRAVADAMLPKMLTAGAPQEMKERVREIMLSSSAEGVIAALRAMADRPDSSDVLPKITVPTLVVVGEEDSITPVSDAERMAKAIPNAKLVKIAGAAHLSNYERAEEVNRVVESSSRLVV
jgi:pimeloyl-ACP methyl ester carboxylesterase